jgi:quercetin dioxygenase-like cupin family protein
MQCIRIPLLALLLVALAVPGMAGVERTSAQSGGQPLDLPCADDVSAMPLGQAVPDETTGQVLVSLRVELAPGGRLGDHTHPGTLIVAVESGAFGFTMVDASSDDAGSHAAMQIMRAQTGEASPAAETMQAGTEYVLNPGDWIVEPLGMVHSIRTVGDQPTSVLVTGLVTADQPLIQCLPDESAS